MEAHRKIPDCPVEMTLQLIGDKWKVLIIRDLMSGTKRFNELMRSVTGITQKVLTSHLRAMEQDGLLTRKVYPEVPPRVEYTLTETGRSLKPILIPWWPGEPIIKIPPLASCLNHKPENMIAFLQSHFSRASRPCCKAASCLYAQQHGPRISFKHLLRPFFYVIPEFISPLFYFPLILTFQFLQPLLHLR